MDMDDERECDETCLEHAEDCDGFCDHFNHHNMCLITTFGVLAPWGGPVVPANDNGDDYEEDDYED